MPERNCGYRAVGGVYLELDTSPYGEPIERYLMDPPLPVDTEGLGISPVGTTLVQAREAGVHHVMDWIGSQSYPNVADFIEEVREMGLSRRVSKNTDFTRLTRASRLVCLHSRAYFDEWPAMNALPDYVGWPCKKRIHAQNGTDTSMCLWHVYADLTGTELELNPDGFIAGCGGDVERVMPSFSYWGWQRPEGVTRTYRTAIFASFPVSRIAVVSDEEGAYGSLVSTVAEQTLIPVEEVME